MNVQITLFYIFSFILCFSAIRLITVRNPVHAALFLVLAFFTAGMLWVLIGADFLGITLVMIYVGAVMVLFLFVIMMLNLDLSQLRKQFWSHLPAGLLVGGIILFEMSAVFLGKLFSQADTASLKLASSVVSGSARDIGLLLYSRYLYPFELVGLLLLVAAVGAVGLTLRHRPEVKRQKPSEQVRVKSQDRLKIVSDADLRRS